MEEKIRNNRFGRFWRRFMFGAWLRWPGVQRRLGYVFFIVALMMLYIGNGYLTQRLNCKHTRLSNEVKELRTKSLSFTERRMTATRQSEILKALKAHEIELNESVSPPKVVD